MLIRRIEGATNIIGADQGYLALPLRQRETDYVIGHQTLKTVATETAWEPTPDELIRIQNGHSIIVQQLLFGADFPPIQVYVSQDKGGEGFDRITQFLQTMCQNIEDLQVFVKGVLDEQMANVDADGVPKDIDTYQSMMENLKALNEAMTLLARIK